MCTGSLVNSASVRSSALATRPEQWNSPSTKNANLLPVSCVMKMDTVATRLYGARCFNVHLASLTTSCRSSFDACTLKIRYSSPRLAYSARLVIWTPVPTASITPPSSSTTSAACV